MFGQTLFARLAIERHVCLTNTMLDKMFERLAGALGKQLNLREAHSQLTITI